jgi:hypothetical protein
VRIWNDDSCVSGMTIVVSGMTIVREINPYLE